MRQQIAAEVAQVVPAHHEIIHDRESFLCIAFGDAVHDAREHLNACDTERGFNILSLYLSPEKLMT